ncbi:replication protein [Methylovulum psychrotolerans]|uniref:Replication protein n=1 Tax=Methylovulum psychrotolerans TaxID=1704499 RepID=A0A2S5CFM9_9GAMM|nr:replication protein [Methylovulum psychrotolerans]MBT9100473.1 replication protein [Methylovulum psychrotolerans]POZ49609.1 replication protein [Methylovulum psychrotolerans]
MNEKANTSTRKKQLTHPKQEDFNGRQIDLFQSLLCNTETERDSLSNVFDLWDSIPRYIVSRQQQDKWRKAGTFPLLYEIPFHYRGRELTATIQPAAIKGKDGIIQAYFPSANEELIEDVLRKIATIQNNGYYNQKENRSGVVFTLHMVRKELEKRGHGRTYSEINLSLEIMARSVIITSMADGKDGEFTSNSLYLNNLFKATKSRIAEDPNTKWFADFHPFASRALDELTYRQFNYARLMSHRSQLARWINKVLSLKYLNASFTHPFEMRFSTIKRDSGLLNGYTLLRLAVAAVDTAFKELHDCKPSLLGNKTEKKIIEGNRGKILDVIYTLHPSREFMAEVKAASKRQAIASNCPKPINKSNPRLIKQGV